MFPERTEMCRAGRKALLIFLLAIIVRLPVFVQVTQNPEVILQPDSRMYLALSEGLLQYKSLVYPESPNQPDAERMPGYPLFVALIMSLFGGNLLGVVVVQIFLDAINCLLIFYLGETLWRGSGSVSGILASLNIGMITYSHFVLNETLFLSFFLFFLIAALAFLLKPEWKTSCMMGVLTGVGTLIRPVIFYLPFFSIPAFFLYLTVHSKVSPLLAAGKVLLMALFFLSCIAPWMYRNHTHFGTWGLSAQGGEHLLQYVVPFTWQHSRGIPFIEGMQEAGLAFREKAGKEGLDPGKMNPFVKSDYKTKMAFEFLREAPKAAIAKAWFFGIIKNLFAPAAIDFSYLLKISRPHFFYTEGKTLFARGWNLIRGIKGWFRWALIGSIVGLVISRLIQVLGFVLLFQKRKWEAGLCVLIIGYFLALSGPVGYAKYRLPFEPILIVLLAIGLRDLWERWKGRRLRLEV